jgi:hypothetical protein
MRKMSYEMKARKWIFLTRRKGCNYAYRISKAMGNLCMGIFLLSRKGLFLRVRRSPHGGEKDDRRYDDVQPMHHIDSRPSKGMPIERRYSGEQDEGCFQEGITQRSLSRVSS